VKETDEEDNRFGYLPESVLGQLSLNSGITLSFGILNQVYILHEGVSKAGTSYVLLPIR
jgi:hypothetical protein